MRAAALSIAAALLVAAAPADAARSGKKRPPAWASSAAKHARSKQREGAPGWRAAPRKSLVTVMLAPPSSPDAATPVEPAGAPAEWPAPAAPPAPPPSTPPAPACDPSPWLGAIAEDVGGFRLRLTRTCVPAGTVLVQLRNNDLADHNLWAEGVAPVRAPRQLIGRTEGETIADASTTLAEGRWRLYCSFEGHESMSRTLDVTSASR